MSLNLIALDLDGTSLRSDGTFSDRIKSILNKLAKEGVYVTIATGRSPLGVHPYVKQLCLEQHIPTVCYNGSSGIVMHCVDGDVSHVDTLFVKAIPEDLSARLLKFSIDRGLVVQVLAFS